ncbi:hypothetical protein B0H15DRAFT_893549 [Mycena belliarum]|uniref:DNA damage-responsive protein 48 n=1 Tax=Mycena belliarum TaxID=1033014 RepID=A0AAD6TQM5_9AGAR|nr:hypothetical protein B0H15DRAFT_893549 [Mycena belliae]
MDFINKLTGEHGSNAQAGHANAQPQSHPESSSGGGGFMSKINNSMGGGESGEKKEDFLDKAVDFVQEKMGGGSQKNESAFEQAKDEQISDAIRRQYKNATGKEFPVKDKS